MAISWPTAQDSTSTFPTDVTEDTDSKTGTPRTGAVSFHAALHRDTNLALLAIESELGNTPKGGFASVKERLDGSDFKRSCRAATSAALPACTYSNGSSGVGATLTATANGVLPAQDGITLVTTDRLFVKNQAAPAQNGIYEVTSVGSVGTPWVLTRTIDADTAVKVSDTMLVTVEQGLQGADTFWELVSDNPITVGTSALRYTRLHPAYPNASLPAAATPFMPTNGILENYDRGAMNSVVTAAWGSGDERVWKMGILRAGQVCSGISLFSSIAGATYTVNWFGIARLVGGVYTIVAVSANSTAVWPASAFRNFTWTSPYTPDVDEAIFAFGAVAATTMPTFVGLTLSVSSVMQQTPIVAGRAGTAQTATPPAVGSTLNPNTAAAGIPYAFLT